MVGATQGIAERPSHAEPRCRIEANGAAPRSLASSTLCDGPPRARSRGEPAAPRRPTQQRAGASSGAPRLLLCQERESPVALLVVVRSDSVLRAERDACFPYYKCSGRPTAAAV